MPARRRGHHRPAARTSLRLSTPSLRREIGESANLSQLLTRFKFLSLTWIHLQVPEGYTVAVSSVPGQPDALLVKAEEDTSRDGLLASLFPQEAVSLSRNYDVTYKVQCLVRHARCASMEADASMEWRGGLTSLSTPPVTATIPTGVGLEPSDHATSPSNDCSLFANSHVARRSTRSI